MSPAWIADGRRLDNCSSSTTGSTPTFPGRLGAEGTNSLSRAMPARATLTEAHLHDAYHGNIAAGVVEYAKSSKAQGEHANSLRITAGHILVVQAVPLKSDPLLRQARWLGGARSVIPQILAQDTSKFQCRSPFLVLSACFAPCLRASHALPPWSFTPSWAGKVRAVCLCNHQGLLLARPFHAQGAIKHREPSQGSCTGSRHAACSLG